MDWIGCPDAVSKTKRIWNWWKQILWTNCQQAYSDQVDRLKPELAKHEALLWLRRYESLIVPGLLLSHQYWADQQALSAWCRNSNHLVSQREGINSIFEDYRIRVGHACGTGIVILHQRRPGQTTMPLPHIYWLCNVMHRLILESLPLGWTSLVILCR